MLPLLTRTGTSNGISLCPEIIAITETLLSSSGERTGMHRASLTVLVARFRFVESAGTSYNIRKRSCKASKIEEKISEQYADDPNISQNCIGR